MMFAQNLFRNILSAVISYNLNSAFRYSSAIYDF